MCGDFDAITAIAAIAHGCDWLVGQLSRSRVHVFVCSSVCGCGVWFVCLVCGYGCGCVYDCVCLCALVLASRSGDVKELVCVSTLQF
jgi:hypothetical protein